MSKKDRKNLQLIAEMTERGEEFFLFRAHETGSAGWRRVVVSRNGKEFDGQGSIESRNVTGKFYSNIVNEEIFRRKAVDLRYVNNSYNKLEMKVAIEVVKPKLSLVVFGGGHVGQAVAFIGAILGYDVLVVDDRVEFASRNRFPDLRINLMAGDYGKISGSLKIRYNSALVIVTRGHQFDEVCLRNIIRSDAGYIGMIGSKRRTISVINHLKRSGYCDVDFSRLHAPIGLQIGARSPQEIAVAIHAEIVNEFNRSNSQ